MRELFVGPNCRTPRQGHPGRSILFQSLSSLRQVHTYLVLKSPSNLEISSLAEQIRLLVLLFSNTFLIY